MAAEYLRVGESHHQGSTGYPFPPILNALRNEWVPKFGLCLCTEKWKLLATLLLTKQSPVGQILSSSTCEYVISNRPNMSSWKRTLSKCKPPDSQNLWDLIYSKKTSIYQCSRNLRKLQKKNLISLWNAKTEKCFTSKFMETLFEFVEHQFLKLLFDKLLIRSRSPRFSMWRLSPVNTLVNDLERGRRAKRISKV